MKGKWILAILTLFLLAFLLTNSTAAAGVPEQIEVKVLVRGAALHGTNGLYFGPDGNLYVASVFGGEIVALNPNSGKVLKRIANAGTPDDLTFGTDGSLYWTDIQYGNVWKMKPDGTRQAIASGLPGANPITFPLMVGCSSHAISLARACTRLIRMGSTPLSQFSPTL